MPDTTPHKKYVFVLTHADAWGAFNANALIKTVKAYGAELILIVSRSTPGRDGKPATKIDDLKAPRILKEEKLLEYFSVIDGLPASLEIPEPEYLTFNALAKRYCADGVVHYVHSGGKKGGEEIAAIFDQLNAQGVTPEIVLSGDTLAILPASITGTYPCFGMHPGPLPDIQGMQATGRAVLSNTFYDREGNPLSLNHTLGLGEAYTKGSFFQLASELDEGPVIAEAFSFVCPGMCLFQIRSELYHQLAQVVEQYLKQLLDPDDRRKLLESARSRQQQAHAEREVPPMEEGVLAQWQRKNIMFDFGFEGGPDIIGNHIVDPIHFQNQMRWFYPGAAQEGSPGTQEFEAVFPVIFEPTLQEIEDRRSGHRHRRIWTPGEIKQAMVPSTNMPGR